MTEEERMQIINEHYEYDKAQIEKDDKNLGNMNFYLKKEEYIKKHLWKTEKQFMSDLIQAAKKRIR